MSLSRADSHRGFTLIELLVALLILSLLSVMAYRGLGAVLDTQAQVEQETDKWRRAAAFFARFEQDVKLAAPRPVRNGYGTAPAWLAQSTEGHAQLEFSRFAGNAIVSAASRVSYTLNARNEIEIGLWPGLDVPPGALPARYTMLPSVARFEMDYLTRELSWVDRWPAPGAVAPEPLPRAVRVRIVLASGEAISRVFALAAPW